MLRVGDPNGPGEGVSEMRKLFGTDGIRGTANREPITAETALAVAMAAGAEFHRGDHRHLVVIGKDTRLSGYLLEPALTAGFVSVGMDVVLLGPLPTPAVAMLTRSLRADLGVMISASHNPYQDNGIKLFGPDGYKLSDAVEQAIEQRIGGGGGSALAPPEQLGHAERLDDSVGRYIEFVKHSFPKGLRLDGLKIVVDCAHGAAYRVAPKVLYELGAEVVTLGVAPNGANINRECGATTPGAMQAAVVAVGANFGLALDGDADRVVVSDENGKLVDGDQLIGLVTRSWQESGRLRGGGVVGTVMANLGLEHFVEGLSLDFVRTPVGDRYVVERMRDGGYNVGGEQSGHIVLSDYCTTGDGQIAALQILAVLVERGGPASEICHVFDPLPQVLKSVRFNGGAPLEHERVRAAIDTSERTLGTAGRVLVRKSGTEPVVRVMAEGQDAALVDKIVNTIIETIEQVSN
jgi:phosphoglucosamine mutase